MTTSRKFLAAARTMFGPPMSMFSISSSKVAAGLAAAGPRRAAGFDWRTSANQVLEVLRECG